MTSDFLPPTGLTLVLGATGPVGAPLVHHLLNSGHRVRATSRRPELRATKMPGAEWVRWEAGDPRIPQSLVEGVERAFLLSPDEGGAPDEALRPTVLALAERPETRVVALTGMGPDTPPQQPFRRLEAELHGRFEAVAVLRANWFMQNLETYWLEEIRHARTLSLPAADASVSFVDTRDLAEAAARLLADGAPTGTFTFTGPESLSFDEVARRVSDAAQRTVIYRPVTDAEFRSGLAQVGFPPPAIDLLVALFQDIRSGALAEVSDDPMRILGRPARSLDDYLEGRGEIWRAGEDDESGAGAQI